MAPRSECALEWQLHLERSGKSRAYTTHVEIFFRRHILPHLGELDIREICRDDVEKLQLSLKEKGLSQNSVKSCLQVLMSLMQRYHIRKQVLDRIPPFPEKWSATPQQDRWVVDEATQRQMWERMPKDTHLLMETLCALGCRPSEVCGLRKKDLLPDGRILIQRAINVYGVEVRTKTGKTRTHALPIELHTRLSNLRILPETYLFRKGDGSNPYNPNRLSNMFRAANNDRREISRPLFRSLAPKVSLARALSKMGYCSRGQAVKWIAEGRVRVSGRGEKEGARRVDP